MKIKFKTVISFNLLWIFNPLPSRVYLTSSELSLNGGIDGFRQCSFYKLLITPTEQRISRNKSV